MCTIDSFINRYSLVMRDTLGMPIEIVGEGEEREIVFQISKMWCRIATTAPEDPELTALQCIWPAPDLDEAAIMRVADRVEGRIGLAKVLRLGDKIMISVASVTASPDCLPSAAHLAAILPRLRGALAAALRAWVEEYRFEAVIGEASDERVA